MELKIANFILELSLSTLFIRVPRVCEVYLNAYHRTACFDWFARK